MNKWIDQKENKSGKFSVLWKVEIKLKMGFFSPKNYSDKKK